MKKNKGFLMGIAALALLFSMAFLGCESATGAQGDPGDGRELLNFTINAGYSVVVPGRAESYQFTANYAGIGIPPKDTIIWTVTGDDPDAKSEDGFKHPGTSIVRNTTTGYGQLTVDEAEKSTWLTVTASYGGYTNTAKVEVGVPELPGLDLIPGREIGTTNVVNPSNIYRSIPISNAGNPTDNKVGTYLVYTLDPKKVEAVSRTEKVSFVGTVKVNPDPTTPDVEYDIVLPQEQYITIYEVPLATGVPVDGHTTVFRFLSLPAAAYNSSNVNLPLMTSIAGPNEKAPSYPYLTRVDGPGTSAYRLDGVTQLNYLNGKTSDDHGGYPTGYTAYLVYYSPYDPVTGEAILDPTKYEPGLNTKFVPPSGNFVGITANQTGNINLPKTGNWYYILQYTGTAPNTGTNAWAYVKVANPHPTTDPNPEITEDKKLLVADAPTFTVDIDKPDGPVNTVHISLYGDREFREEKYLQDYQTTLFTAYTYAQVTRDSATGVTLYLNNADRTSVSGTPVITVSSAAFKWGSAPKIDQDDDDFIKVSGSDVKYSDIVISGQTAAGITFTAGTQTQITVASGNTPTPFPIGNTENTYNGEAIGAIQWNISWYYVNGSNWVSTGTPNGSTFTPLEEDKGKTIGIRVDAEGNSPDVTLVEETTSTSNIKKWNYIGYGQRILGAVVR